jgi:hypothetical protein
MELLNVSVGDVVENSWNPNKMDEVHFNALVESMRTHPELLEADRLITRTKGNKYELLGGAHRFRASKVNGFKKVPIGNLGVIDDAEAQLISLILNNHGEEDFDKKLDIIYSMKSSISVADVANHIGEDAINLKTLVDGMASGVEEIADLFSETDAPEEPVPDFIATMVRAPPNAPIFEAPHTTHQPRDPVDDISGEFNLYMPETVRNKHEIPSSIKLPITDNIKKAIEKGFSEGENNFYNILNNACKLYIGG